jgi:hypothetical protein
MRALFIALLLLLTAPAQAQIAPPIVRGGGLALLYPQAAHAALNLTVPARRVESITLTFTIDGRPADPITIADARTLAIYADEAQAQLRYTWEFPASAPPQWFQTVGVLWELTLRDGRTAQYDAEVLFTDPRHTWRVVRVSGAPARFAITPDFARLGIDLPAVYTRMAENTGGTPPIDWIIYPQDATVGCESRVEDGRRRFYTVPSPSGFAIPCDPLRLPPTLGTWRIMRPPRGVSIETHFTARLLAAFYDSAWAGKRVPAWFRESLVRFYAPASDAALLTIARQRFRTGQIYPIDALRVADPDPGWSAQSHALFAWLIDRIGALGVLRLANRIAGADDFDAALREFIDIAPEAILPAVNAWIFSPSADAAFGVSPYQEPTPVPSSTPTPSATPTVTPTLTPTATATLTPPPTRTTAPTITPRPTEARTAPPTPRPPGSLETPTPVPTPVTPSLIDQLDPETTRAGVLGVLIVLLAVLFVLLIRANRPGGRS